MSIVRLLITADNRTAIRMFKETALAAEKTSKEIQAANEKAARAQIASQKAVYAQNLKTAQAWTRTGYAIQSVGRGVATLGAGMLYVGYKSAKMAIDFNTSMTRLVTQAGAGQNKLAEFSKGVEDLATSGKSFYGPTSLADGIYHIVSVGYGLKKPSDALGVLNVAQKEAAMSGANLEDTATALASAMVATHAKVGQASSVMGLLNAAVGAGNMRFQDLNQALGRSIIPAFQQVGLNISDAMGALDVFTDAGYKASSASAQVSTALHYLVKPSKQATKDLAYLGMSSYQMAADLHKPRGLLMAMKDLRSHLEKLPGGLKGVEAGQVLADLFPGGRGRIMLTLLQNLDRYRQKLDFIAKHQKEWNQKVAEFAKTPGARLHAAWAAIQGDLTKFGATLLPFIQEWLPRLTSLVTGLIGAFTGMSKPLRTILEYAAPLFFVGGALLIGLGKMFVLIGQIRGAYVSLKAAAFGAAAAEEAANTAGMGGGAGGAGAAGTAAGKEAQKASKLSRVVRGVGNVGRFLPILGGVVIAGEVAQALGLRARKDAKPRTKSPYYTSRFGAQGGLVTPEGIRRYQYGGPVGTDTVPAMLSPGEGVLTRAAMASIGVGGLAALNAGGGAPIVIHPAPVYLTVDGRMLARTLINFTTRSAARGPSTISGGSLAVPMVTTP